MSRTPYMFNRPIAAGLSIDLPVAGKMLTIFTVTGGPTTVDVQFDNDQFHTFDMARSYPSDADGFEKVTLRNPTGGAIAVYGMISEGPIADTNATVLAAIAASAASIDQEVTGGAATLQVPDLVLPITGAPAQLIVPANALRTEIEIVADPLNGAEWVFLGIAAAHCSATDKFYVLAAGDPWWSNREKGDIYGCSSAGTAIVNAREC